MLRGDCGGSGGVALWLEVCTKLGIDARAVCDLDALWDSDMQRTLNTLPGLEAALVEEFTERAIIGAGETILEGMIVK